MSRSTDDHARRGGLAATGLLAAVVLAVCAGTARAQTVRVAFARPQGFYDGSALARVEVPIRLARAAGSALAIGGEIYHASKGDNSSTTLSGYVMLRNEPFPRLPVSPFAAIGVGAHAVRSRVEVTDVGTLTATETAAKGHFWAGAKLRTPFGVHPFVETRWTVPSKYVFDYVAAGLTL